MGEAAYWIASGYSQQEGDDIALLRLTPQGLLTKVAGIRQGESPSFLAVLGDVLYAGCEGGQRAKIVAYHVSQAGFRQKGAWEGEGQGLCHLALGPSLLVGSCYGSGDFFAVDLALSREVWRFRPPEDGRERHAHCAVYHEGALYAVDLGGDCVFRFERQGDGFSAIPSITRLPQGTGPRQILFSGPAEGFLINELGNSLWPFELEGRSLRLGTPVSCTPEVAQSNYPASGCLSQEGLLAVPVRGVDHLALFQKREGRIRRTLSLPCGGHWPRLAAWAGQGRFLLVCYQHSGQLGCCRYDKEGLTPVSSVEMPGASCCVLWREEGKDDRNHEEDAGAKAGLGASGISLRGL